MSELLSSQLRVAVVGSEKPAKTNYIVSLRDAGATVFGASKMRSLLALLQSQELDAIFISATALAVGSPLDLMRTLRYGRASEMQKLPRHVRDLPIVAVSANLRKNTAIASPTEYPNAIWICENPRPQLAAETLLRVVAGARQANNAKLKSKP